MLIDWLSLFVWNFADVVGFFIMHFTAVFDITSVRWIWAELRTVLQFLNWYRTSVIMHFTESKSIFFCFSFNLLHFFAFSGIWFHLPLLFVYLFNEHFFYFCSILRPRTCCVRGPGQTQSWLLNFLELQTVLSVHEENGVHKFKTSCAFPLISTLFRHSLEDWIPCSFPLHSESLPPFFFNILLLGPTAAHGFRRHRVRELYCLPFLAETCSPGWVPLFLSNNLFLISSSVQRIWLPDVCTYFHSSNCIYGCVAVTSTGFQVKCSSWVVAGGRGKEGRIVHFLCLECTELFGTKQSLSLWWSYEMVGYAFLLTF